MNTQTRLNQLMSFQENLKQKFQTYRKVNYAFINLLPTKNGYAHYLGSRNTYLKKINH